MISVSIIVPCFNAERFIYKNIKKVINELSKNKIFFEIILINDGSTDNTLSEINKLRNKFVKIISLNKNHGKSYAVRRGIKKAKKKFLVLIDCDLPYFDKFIHVIKKLQEGYDFVSINRRDKKSKIINKKLSLYQFFRIFIGNFIGQLIYFIFKSKIKTKDTQAGLKGLRNSQFLNKKQFISKKFFLDIELFYFFSKKKILFVPAKYKINDVSSISFFSINSFKILLEFLKVSIFLKFKM